MELNPYAKYLGEQDARAVLTATPGLLHQAACALTPEQVEMPVAPGKWSVREIVAHLADCELVFSFRLRQTLAEDSAGDSAVRPGPLGEALCGVRSAFWVWSCFVRLASGT